MKKNMFNKILPATFVAVFAFGGPAFADRGGEDYNTPEAQEQNIFRNVESEKRQEMERAIRRSQEMREDMMQNQVRTISNNPQMQGDIKVINSSIQAPSINLTPAQAREIAREANMLGRPSLPPQYQGKVVPGYLFDTNSNIVREIVSEPLKSRLPHYSGYEWLIVGNDLVLVNSQNNVVTEVLSGVFE